MYAKSGPELDAQFEDGWKWLLSCDEDGDGKISYQENLNAHLKALAAQKKEILAEAEARKKERAKKNSKNNCGTCYIF